jgi:putative photosynthetic complex assembly protein
MSDMHEHHQRPFPRNTLIIVGTIMLLSLMMAFFGHLSGQSISKPTAPPVAARDLLFRDQADGAVAIYDAQDPSAPIAIAAPGTNGFLRATMRGLARQRLRIDDDRAAEGMVPFHLTEWADGRLTLEDPVTHRTVEMEAFGITQEEVFAHLLQAKPMTPQQIAESTLNAHAIDGRSGL